MLAWLTELYKMVCYRLKGKKGMFTCTRSYNFIFKAFKNFTFIALFRVKQ